MLGVRSLARVVGTVYGISREGLLVASGVTKKWFRGHWVRV